MELRDRTYLKNLLPRVFRTEGDVVQFDPKKIELSLKKETNLDEKSIQKITELVIRRIISSGIKFLSGPHIREIICSILSEQHFEEERKLYTRIGMPLMDYEEILEANPEDRGDNLFNPEKIHHWAANQLAEEYSLLRILNDEESHAHLYGDIYIHQLKYFDLRPYSQTWDPRIILKFGFPPVSNFSSFLKLKPAINLRDAVSQLIDWLGRIQGEFSGDQGLSFIPMFLAPYINNLSEAEIKKELRDLIFKISQLYYTTGQGFHKSTIHCYPTIIEDFSNIPAIGPFGHEVGVYANYKKECLKIFKILIEVYQELENDKSLFSLPKHLVYFNKRWLKDFANEYSEIFNEIKKIYLPILSNYRNDKLVHLMDDVSGKSFYNYGIVQKISLNLPRFAYRSKDKDVFFEILENKMQLCFGILDKKFDIIKKRIDSKLLPLCGGLIENQPLFNLENQNLSLCIIGLNEAVKYLSNYELHESSTALDLGKRILIEMYKICENNSNKKYLLLEEATNKVIYRFAKLDMKHFPEKSNPLVREDFPKYYYSNSVHFNEDNDFDLRELVTKQGEYHKFIKNGAINLISLNKYQEELKSYNHFEQFLDFICTSTEISNIKFIK